MSQNEKAGYKHPPKHSQFKPGQSGNPKGRPKGINNLATDLEEELSESVIIHEGGKQAVTSKQRAMIKAMMSKALKGDTRAANALITLKLGIEHVRYLSNDEEILSEEDMAILEEYKNRNQTESKPEEDA
jgi:hypothetical protein